MKSPGIFACAIAAASMLSAAAEEPTHLNVFHKSAEETEQVVSIPLADAATVTFGNDGDTPGYNLLNISWLDETRSLSGFSGMKFGTNVPLISITTDPVVNDITSKTEYLDATLTLNAYGTGDDVTDAAVSIRGRGNTTWRYPKKPYRLKFPKKTALPGVRKAKNYVLIANYIDATLMKNSLALKLAEMLGMPYANNPVPVNVELNGDYKGAYMLTEKQGINSGSVDIDEQTGILWELDTNYDEDYKFRSPIYNLPVMLADPDPADVVAEGQTPEEWFEPWKADFIEMERRVRAGEAAEVLDMQQIADFLIVNTVCCNREISWPKSTKLYKASISDLYSFGPVWDFDWGFNFVNSTDTPVFQQSSQLLAVNFFRAVILTDAFSKTMAERWAYFKENVFDNWMEYFDSYAAEIRVSALQNGERWDLVPKYCSADFDNQTAILRQWIIDRVAAIDAHPHYLLIP